MWAIHRSGLRAGTNQIGDELEVIDVRVARVLPPSGLVGVEVARDRLARRVVDVEVADAVATAQEQSACTRTKQFVTRVVTASRFAVVHVLTRPITRVSGVLRLRPLIGPKNWENGRSEFGYSSSALTRFFYGAVH